MKKLFVAILFTAACAKTNDVGRLEDEAVEIARSYQPTVHELEQRANELLKVKLPEDPSSKLKDARAGIAHLKGEIAGTTRERLEAERAKSTEADFVQKKVDNVEDDLREGVIVTTDQISAVESWVAVAERTPVMPVMDTPPAPAQ